MPAPWHYDDVLANASITYRDWRRLVLAPLVSIGLVNGLSETERKELVYFAQDRRLIDQIEEDEEALRNDLDRLVADSDLRRNQEIALRNLVFGLPPEIRTRLIFQMWDAGVLLARSTYDGESYVDAAEKEELIRFAMLLGIGETADVRDILGSSARLLAFPQRTAFEATAAPRAKGTPASWAAGWKDFSANAWRDLNALVDAQEAALRNGEGRLDQVQSLEQFTFPAQAFIDRGVLVMPANLSERDVYLIGDIHGDYTALEGALQITGLERKQPRPILVFLGDYGDRGVATLAVWLRLAEIKARYPEDVYLLRGNHEDLLSVECVRANDKKPIGGARYVPFVTNNDTYIALGFSLENNFSNIAILFESLPAVALFPDRLMAVHGGPVPRWKQNDGWKLSDEAKSEIAVETVADLRKPKAQFVMRWVDIIDRDDVDLAWTDYGGSGRLAAAGADLRQWQERLGILRIVHGHTHPIEGFEWACGERSLALNTSRATGRTPAIARWAPNTIEPILLSIGAD